MKVIMFFNFILQIFLLWLHCLNTSHGSKFSKTESLGSNTFSTSPEPQPFLPVLTPSALTPISNGIMPLLSGLCALNFSSAETILQITAIDCWDSFAPYLANVVCCPQLDATLTVLIGQSSLHSGDLSLNLTHANHCLSDVERILESRGSTNNLQTLCSVNPTNLTKLSCPVSDIVKFETIVNSSKLLHSCDRIDPVNECCKPVCHTSILDAARELAFHGYTVLPEHYLHMIDDCTHVVLRWVASKLDASSAIIVLRGLSSCEMNKACPLKFPNITNVARECGNVTSNKISCCDAMSRYMLQLQEQSFITNLQALNCASMLGLKLRKANVSNNIYTLCHVNLKDFSLQESDCLLPSLPLDATYDQTSGIGFICDLNDNIAAPWTSTSFTSNSTCDQTTKIPTLPKSASTLSCLYDEYLLLLPLFTCSLLLHTSWILHVM